MLLIIIILKAVINKLQEVIAARGRKSTNPKHYVRSLQELFRIADEVCANKFLYVLIFCFSIALNNFDLEFYH